MVTLSKEDKVECIRSNNSLHHAGSNPVPTSKQSTLFEKSFEKIRILSLLYLSLYDGLFFQVEKSSNKVAKKLGS